MDLLKGMVLSENKSYMADTHFAEFEGIREESTLLLRNFYKVILTKKVWKSDRKELSKFLSCKMAEFFKLNIFKG